MSASELSRILQAVADLYVVLSTDAGEAEFAAALDPADSLRIRSVDTGGSITIVLFGTAGTVALPAITAVSAATAAAAAWLIGRRKDWHEGTKLKHEGRSAAVAAALDRARAIDEAKLISDPLLRRQTLAELNADEFYGAVFDANNVQRASVNGEHIEAST